MPTFLVFKVKYRNPFYLYSLLQIRPGALCKCFSTIYKQKCFDLSGRCSHGTKETVHACGDGPGSDGEESVQGEVHGATRGC